jgi:hypothetical protein
MTKNTNRIKIIINLISLSIIFYFIFFLAKGYVTLRINVSSDDCGRFSVKGESIDPRNFDKRGYTLFSDAGRVDQNIKFPLRSKILQFVPCVNSRVLVEYLIIVTDEGSKSLLTQEAVSNCESCKRNDSGEGLIMETGQRRTNLEVGNFNSLLPEKRNVYLILRFIPIIILSIVIMYYFIYLPKTNKIIKFYSIFIIICFAALLFFYERNFSNLPPQEIGRNYSIGSVHFYRGNINTDNILYFLTILMPVTIFLFSFLLSKYNNEKK